MSKVKLLAIIALIALTVVNLSVLLKAGSATITIRGKGDAYKKEELGKSPDATKTTTWGCNRENDNYCEMTIKDSW